MAMGGGTDRLVADFWYFGIINMLIPFPTIWELLESKLVKGALYLVNNIVIFEDISSS